MGRLIESNFYKQEGEYIHVAFQVLTPTIDNNSIFVAGSLAGKIILSDSGNNFIKKEVFPVSRDIDILIKYKDLKNLLQLGKYHPIRKAQPTYRTSYEWYGINEVRLPFENYKLNEGIDVFVGGICAIPATKSTYRIEETLVYNGFSLNVPEKSFIFATYINTLAMTTERFNRFFILAVDEFVRNGEEQLKTKIYDTTYYVALGSERVAAKKEELDNSDPNNNILHEEDFIEYDKKFEKVPKVIDAGLKKLVRIARYSGFQGEDAERVGKIVRDVISEYGKILQTVKRK